MKKIILSLIIPVLTVVFVNAQSDTVRNWKREIEAGLNLNQASFSDNWKGGGINSLSINSLLNAKAYYEKDRISFANEAKLLYGVIQSGDFPFRKNQDMIFLDTKLGYKISDKWNVFGSVNFLSQFVNGYEYDNDSTGAERRKYISSFFAPAYLTSSIGLEYKPRDYFWVRFGTGTLRQTFVTDKRIRLAVPTNYGVDTNEIVRHEIAFQLIVNYEREIRKNLNIKTRYLGFANYQNLASIDSRFDFSLIAKITKYINVNFTAIIIYDDDMDYKVQYSHGLALGFLYSFSEFKKD